MSNLLRHVFAQFKHFGLLCVVNTNNNLKLFPHLTSQLISKNKHFVKYSSSMADTVKTEPAVADGKPEEGPINSKIGAVEIPANKDLPTDLQPASTPVEESTKVCDAEELVSKILTDNFYIVSICSLYSGTWKCRVHASMLVQFIASHGKAMTIFKSWIGVQL